MHTFLIFLIRLYPGIFTSKDFVSLLCEGFSRHDVLLKHSESKPITLFQLLCETPHGCDRLLMLLTHFDSYNLPMSLFISDLDAGKNVKRLNRNIFEAILRNDAGLQLLQKMLKYKPIAEHIAKHHPEPMRSEQKIREVITGLLLSEAKVSENESQLQGTHTLFSPPQNNSPTSANTDVKTKNEPRKP